MPESVRLLYQALIMDLQKRGYNPGKKWQNYSSLGKDRYHCHLNYRYVACWEVKDYQIEIMEVYYVGSREKAPY